MTKPSHLTEGRLDAIAGCILLTGSIVATCLILAGTILAFVHSGGVKQPRLIGQDPLDVWRAALHLQGHGLLNLGVLVFMITPVLRVISALVGFSVLRSWRFALVSLVVLGMLVLSFVVSTGAI